MKPGLMRVTACSLSLMLLPAMGYLTAASAQYPPPPQGSAPISQAPTYQPQQLDQLLAPIALYPDPLLAQVMMASTYPLEVVEAARWVQDRNNARLRGDQLNAALEQQDWDPSVKSLVPFPQILQLMNSRLDWTQALGNAFLAQQGDVMDSVQRLRAQARAAGTLQSTAQEVVSTDGPLITIEPANPQLVYVPYYDPRVIYGSWGYPDYPPIYFAPPPNYGYVAGPGISFGIGFGIIGALWGWDQWDWGRHDISINPERYNSINNYEIAHDNRPRVTANTWQHDPGHRRGVPYSNPTVRQQFQPAAAGAADTRRGFRGFDNRASAPGTASPAAAGQATREQRGAAGAGARGTGPATAIPTAPVSPAATGQATREQRGAPTAGTRRTEPAAANPAATRVATPNAVPRPAPTVATPPTAARTVTAPQRPAPVALGGAAPRPVAQRPVAPAFSSFGRGPEIQAQSQRGQASRQAITQAAPRVAAPRAAAPPVAHAPAPPAARAAAPARPVSAGSSQKGGGDDKHH